MTEKLGDAVLAFENNAPDRNGSNEQSGRWQIYISLVGGSLRNIGDRLDTNLQ
jgi:hypothetical protein